MKNVPSLRAPTLICLGVYVAMLGSVSATSLQFNGVDSRAVLDGSYLGGGEHSNYTFNLWINPATLGPSTLLGKAQFWREWWLNLEADGGLSIGGAWEDHYWGSDPIGNVTTGVWQNIGVAVQDSAASFYLNGTLLGTRAVQSPIDFTGSTYGGPLLDGPMAIGYADSGTTPNYRFYSGLLYGITVWDRTLSAEEILALATTGVPLSTVGLQNQIMLDEGAGTVIHDMVSPLTGRVLSAEWSPDAPTFKSVPEGSPGWAGALAVVCLVAFGSSMHGRKSQPC